MGAINTGFSSAVKNTKDSFAFSIYSSIDTNEEIRKAIELITKIKIFKEKNMKDPDFSDFPDSLIYTAKKLADARQKRQELESENLFKKTADFLSGNKLKNAKEIEKTLTYQLKVDFNEYFSAKCKLGLLESVFTSLRNNKLSILCDIKGCLSTISDEWRNNPDAYPWEKSSIVQDL